jgi:simple sugar transport system ATP-binding protein
MTTTMTPTTPILEMTGITKTFSGVKVLDDVDFRLLPGEIHALMGENGAGKSTLMKILTGAYDSDAGRIVLNGQPVQFASPLEAQRGGVSAVYQEVNLCPNLSVAENISIGREPRRFGRIQWRAVRGRATEALARVNVDIDVAAPLAGFSIALQQMVAIARALDISADVLILDEPTSSLDQDEVEQLFGVIRRLRSEGIAIVFISHFLEQVYEIADRITVLRNGLLVAEAPTVDLPPVALVSKMLGRELQTLEALERLPKDLSTGPASTPVVQAESLGRKGVIEPFDLAVMSGEIVGLAGLLGSGRTELARLLFGADRSDSGRISFDGTEVTVRTPRATTARGVAFCPENRRTEGLVEELTVRENIVLALQAGRGWTNPIPRKRQDALVARWIKALDIRPDDPDRAVGTLSGGNQQKVLLARWLLTEPKLLILDEPTRGIDVGAKTEIQRLVRSLCDEGMAVLFISAELEEVMRLSHRVAVLRDRRVISQLDNDDDVTVERLVHTIAGTEAA